MGKEYSSIIALTKIVTTFLVIMGISSPLNAQNLEKYWNYRLRLDEEFLLIGEGIGKSIPADHRNNLINQIKWSDATVDQGWYIGTLATEHYLLSHPEQFSGYSDGTYDLSQNTEALYYALKALQRLDISAETSFILCPGIPQENGFFIRDDVPINFHLNFPGMSSIFSDFVSLNIYDKEMSQDQMYHVLLGLSLVKRYVDPTVSYDDENLSALTEQIGTGILSHVAGYSDWTIKNPVCNKIVDRGPYAWSLSFGTNEMIKWITDGTVNYDTDPIVILNQGVWPAIGQATNPIHLNSDNTHMIMTIGAVGKLWNNNTMNRLMNMATLQDFYLYPMLHGALYGRSEVANWYDHESQLSGISQEMLDEAPADGPASPQPLAGTHGWATANRFIRDRADQVNGGGNSIGRTYHGLDYMLLHNLNYILFECPEVTFEPLPNESYCSYKKDIDLSPYGQPAGGIFTGPGVLADQFFNPSVSGPGIHLLTYTYTSPSGCIVSDSIEVIVDVCTGISNTSALSGILSWPNPADDNFSISFNSAKNISLDWVITDAIGRVVLQIKDKAANIGENMINFDISTLSSGNYHIQGILDGQIQGGLTIAIY